MGAPNDDVPYMQIGDRFSRLVVIEELPPAKPRRGNRVRCLCDCGTEVVDKQHLKGGHTRSCGCFKRDTTRATMRTHGATVGLKRTAEYEIWNSMRSRCNRPSHPRFASYGGRGIKVAPRWESFEAFLADMGPRPSSRHSIDRVDNNNGYGPGNCRWATFSEQARNTRQNRNLTFRGETMCITDWSARAKMPPRVIETRIRKGWDTERALTEPIRSGPRRGQSPFC